MDDNKIIVNVDITINTVRFGERRPPPRPNSVSRNVNYRKLNSWIWMGSGFFLGSMLHPSTKFHENRGVFS